MITQTSIAEIHSQSNITLFVYSVYCLLCYLFSRISMFLPTRRQTRQQFTITHISSKIILQKGQIYFITYPLKKSGEFFGKRPLLLSTGPIYFLGPAKCVLHLACYIYSGIFHTIIRKCPTTTTKHNIV